VGEGWERGSLEEDGSYCKPETERARVITYERGISASLIKFAMRANASVLVPLMFRPFSSRFPTREINGSPLTAARTCWKQPLSLSLSLSLSLCRFRISAVSDGDDSIRRFSDQADTAGTEAGT
jgi:hypothetical protein